MSVQLSVTRGETAVSSPLIEYAVPAEFPEEFRTRIIAQNLISQDKALQLPSERCTPLSFQQLVRKALEKTHREDGWMRTAFTVCSLVIVLPIFSVCQWKLIAWTVEAIKLTHLQIGHRFDYTYYLNGVVVKREYAVLFTKADFYKEALLMGMGALMITCLLSVPVLLAVFVSLDKDPLLDNFLLLHDYEMETIDNSMKGVEVDDLANDKDAQEITTPVNLDVISKEAIYTNRMINIGAYAMDIEEALKAIINRTQETNGCIPHPIENRYLNPEEQKKFLKDVSNLLCTTQDEILEIWNVDSGEYANFIQRAAWTCYGKDVWEALPSENKAEYKKHLETAVKPEFFRQRFLELIPTSIREKHFPEILKYIPFEYQVLRNADQALVS